MNIENIEDFIDSLSKEEKEDLYNYLLSRYFIKLFAEIWSKYRNREESDL